MPDFTLEAVRRYWPKPDWRDYAACADTDIDPEMFFDVHRIFEAKRICRTCPVFVNCMAFAESRDAEGMIIATDGVWAGMTATERFRRRKRANLPMAG